MSRHLTVTRDAPGYKIGTYEPGTIPKAKAMWLVSRGFAFWDHNPPRKNTKTEKPKTAE